jgi:hypothetical protein
VAKYLDQNFKEQYLLCNILYITMHCNTRNAYFYCKSYAISLCKPINPPELQSLSIRFRLCVLLFNPLSHELHGNIKIAGLFFVCAGNVGRGMLLNVCLVVHLSHVHTHSPCGPEFTQCLLVTHVFRFPV